MALNPSLLPEIGPDGLAREAPVIAYTEKVSLFSMFFLLILIFLPLKNCMFLFLKKENVNLTFCWFCQIIEEEQLQLKKYALDLHLISVLICYHVFFDYIIYFGRLYLLVEFDDSLRLSVQFYFLLVLCEWTGFLIALFVIVLDTCLMVIYYQTIKLAFW